MTITGNKILNVDITGEIKVAMEELGVSFEQIKQMMRNAIEARFGIVDDIWLQEFYKEVENA